MSAGLQLMKVVLTILAKCLLLLFGVTVPISATNVAISNKIYHNNNNFRLRNGRYIENS